MTLLKKEKGNQGERLAEDYLLKQGYEILARQYRSRFGEIDLVARQGRIICFVEVKARYSDEFGSPFEAVSPAKQRKLQKMALWYLQEHKALDVDARFDVVGIDYVNREQPRVELLQNAFDAA